MVIEDDTIPAKRYHQMFGKKEAAKPGESSAPVVYAEVMPQFPGGDKELFNYLNTHMKYPVKAKEKKIQGRVYVSFIVSSKGKILFPHVERGIGGGCDEEAVRVIRNMPPWTAGKQQGKAVPVKYSVPVNFALKK
jgi:protein TonB